MIKYRKRIINLIILFICSWANLLSSSIHKSTTERKITIGYYIDNVYNIDYINSSFEIIFYLWANSYNSFYPIYNVDIDKAIELEKDIIEIDSVPLGKIKKYNCLVKYKAKILNNMDFSKFPFDKLNLQLHIELLEHYSGEKDIKIDLQNSTKNPQFIEKWNLKNAIFSIDSTSYKSNFGDISNVKQPQLNVINLKLELSRNSWNLYWKLFLVLFISTFFVSINVFLPNKLSESKIAIIVGSLFTAIGNKYIAESYLPFTDKINLSDYLHVTTFIFISIFAVFAIYEQRTNKPDSLKKDFLYFVLLNVLYGLTVLLITFHFL